MSDFYVWLEAQDGGRTYLGVFTAEDSSGAAEVASTSADTPGRFHVAQCETALVFEVARQESVEAREWSKPGVVEATKETLVGGVQGGVDQA